MSTTPATARRRLLTDITAALDDGATAAELVDLVIEAGWQPRPTPDPDSDYLEGVLEDGRRVPIEIRHVRRGGAERMPAPAVTAS